MGNPYPGTSVSGYNANPPPDDGTQVATNQITWAGIKSKVGDPLNTFASAVDSNITLAFSKTIDGASIVPTAVNYPMTAADQGRLIKATVAGVIITTPDAATVGAPFVFAVNNQSTGTITLAANAAGGQTVDGLTTQTIATGGGGIFRTDGVNWFSQGLAVSQTINPGKPQGYLTLASSTTQVVPTADITASTAVYYTPYVGNVIPIYNGVNTVNNNFSQLTLTLAAQHLASTLYDVFVFNNAGTLTIGTGPAWTNSGAGAGARGSGAGTTQLAITNGIWTNAASLTARNGASTFTVAANQGTYVGTIFIDSVAGQCSVHVTVGQNRKWGVWNAYNRLPITLQVTDGTATWAYNGAAIRASNNNTANALTVLCGLQEERVLVTFDNASLAISSTSSTSGTPSNGVGWNSTSAFSGLNGGASLTNANAAAVITNTQITAKFDIVAPIGINTATCLEQGNAGGATVTWRGTIANMLMLARWNG